MCILNLWIVLPTKYTKLNVQQIKMVLKLYNILPSWSYFFSMLKRAKSLSCIKKVTQSSALHYFYYHWKLTKTVVDLLWFKQSFEWNRFLNNKHAYFNTTTIVRQTHAVMCRRLRSQVRWTIFPQWHMNYQLFLQMFPTIKCHELKLEFARSRNMCTI